MSQDEQYTVWMLGHMRKRKRMDNFEFQILRDVIKEGGAEVMEKFERKFKDIRIEGKWKCSSSYVRRECS